MKTSLAAGRYSTYSVAHIVAALLAVASVAAGSSARAITYELVTVGNPGNANDPATGNVYGGVAYEYQIGKYDVTIGQYTAFLNAVAQTDAYSLFNANMANELNIAGISQAGSSGAYTYSVIGPSGETPPGASSPANRPITYVSWWDAARFSNWMANGQPTGAQGPTTTEDGAYNVNGVTSGGAVVRNAINPNTGAAPTFYIPLENEWYKAAYYSPVKGGAGFPGYYTYATQSDTTPGNTIGSGANQANYSNLVYAVTQSSIFSPGQNYLTDVGAFTGSESFYGTFDQTGNVFQWNDMDGSADSGRGIRGGDWSSPAFLMSASYSLEYSTDARSGAHGFRLAAAVPEPSTCFSLAAGLACGGYSLFRRRRVR